MSLGGGNCKDFLQNYREHSLEDFQEVHDSITEMSVNDFRHDENTNDDDKYLDTVPIEFDKIIKPRQLYQVRPVCQSHVDEIKKALLAEGSGKLKSMLTVMLLDDDRYELIDGNHRHAAMLDIRRHVHPHWFQKVMAVIYTKMNVAEAISVGYLTNTDSSKGLRMTDYDTVQSIKRILPQVAGHHDTDDEVFNKVYTMLRAFGVIKIFYIFISDII